MLETGDIHITESPEDIGEGSIKSTSIIRLHKLALIDGLAGKSFLYLYMLY